MPRRGPGLSRLSEAAVLETMDTYHCALGSFVSCYAHAEGMLHLTLQMFAGLSDQMGSAILSGVRADHMKDLLNRVLDVTGHSDVRRNLERHLTQFSVITKIRNDILHYGAHWESPEVLLVSNARDAHIPARLRECRITPDDLRLMGADLMTINAGLLFALETVLPSTGPRSREFVQQTAQAAHQPWLYTPPPPEGPARSSRKNQRSQPPQPPASRK